MSHLPRENEEQAALRAYLAERDVACPGCGYNLRGLAGSECPECGSRVRLGLVPQTWMRRWNWVPIAAMAAIAINDGVWLVADLNSPSPWHWWRWFLGVPLMAAHLVVALCGCAISWSKRRSRPELGWVWAAWLLLIVGGSSLAQQAAYRLLF